ncbi:nascent polypeptide-associated complex subunit alpha-like protein 1 [Lolium perenne]|uniref:nascent polypeptide-associated complex subunit alpha-like protein 1 n=1 Tax=Lolium perenne TaxID=4522 RepID=UPI003A98ED6C
MSSEKSSRKAMLKPGHLAVKKSKKPLSFFGEAKIEDLSSQLQSQAPEQFEAPDLSSVISNPGASIENHDDYELVDETSIEPRTLRWR